jgi:hypothetical protein
MKLYELPNMSMFTIAEAHTQSAFSKSVFFLDHLDGMYSFCHPVVDGIPDEKVVVHLNASTKVEPYNV